MKIKEKKFGLIMKNKGNILFVISLAFFVTSIILPNVYLAVVALFLLFLGFSLADSSGGYAHLLRKSSQLITYAIGAVFLVSVPFLIIFAEHIRDYFNDSILLFIATVMAFGYVLYLILNYFIPIREMGGDLSRLSELNFKTINNFDTEFDFTRDLLERINEQLNSEISSIEKENATYKQENFGLLSSSEVKKIELEAGDVWVMSEHLEAYTEDTHTKENVVRKLANSGRYCFIAPETDEVKNNKKSMEDYWLGHIDLDNEALKNVKFILLPQDEWLQAHDVVIYHKKDNVKNRIVEFINLDNSADTIYHELEWDEEKELIQAVATQVNKKEVKKSDVGDE